jgi:hypothetical protein
MIITRFNSGYFGGTIYRLASADECQP